jgi:hypothetical protein
VQAGLVWLPATGSSSTVMSISLSIRLNLWANREFGSFATVWSTYRQVSSLNPMPSDVMTVSQVRPRQVGLEVFRAQFHPFCRHGTWAHTP